MKRLIMHLMSIVLAVCLLCPLAAPALAAGSAGGGGGRNGLNEFVDESTSTVWDAVAETFVEYTSYVYDYATRTYDFTTENGSISISYGDSNISYTQGGVNCTYSYGTENETFFDWLLYWGSGAGAVGVIGDFWRSIIGADDYDTYVGDVQDELGTVHLVDGGLLFPLELYSLGTNGGLSITWYIREYGTSFYVDGKVTSSGGIVYYVSYNGSREIAIPFPYTFLFGNTVTSTASAPTIYGGSGSGTSAAGSLYIPMFLAGVPTGLYSCRGSFWVKVIPYTGALGDYYNNINITINSRPGVVTGYVVSEPEPSPSPSPWVPGPLPTYDPGVDPTPEPGGEDSSPSNWFWKLLEWLGNRIDVLVKFLGGILSSIVDGVASVVSAIVDTIGGFLKRLVDAVEAILAFISGFIGKLSGFLLDLIMNIFEAVVAFVTGLWGFLSGLFDGFADAVTSFFAFMNSDAFDVLGAA